MVLLGADGVEGLPDGPQVQATPAHLQVAGPRQPVLQVQFPQVEVVHGRGHAGGIAIPEEHLVGGQGLAIQIAVHHIVPDQAVGSQQTEGASHVGPIQIAPDGHALLQEI